VGGKRRIKCTFLMNLSRGEAGLSTFGGVDDGEFSTGKKRNLFAIDVIRDTGGEKGIVFLGRRHTFIHRGRKRIGWGERNGPTDDPEGEAAENISLSKNDISL